MNSIEKSIEILNYLSNARGGDLFGSMKNKIMQIV